MSKQLTFLPPNPNPLELKVLTLWQPWASLIALGFKSYETRSWAVKYRGKLAIHAAKREIKPGEFGSTCIYLGSAQQVLALNAHAYSNYGVIVAVADLTDCLPMTNGLIAAQTRLELSVGWWEFGRIAWKLENVIALPTPIPYRGLQALHTAPTPVAKQIQQQLETISHAT